MTDHAEARTPSDPRHIWCPACGCDVKHLLADQIRRDYKRVKADKRKIREAIQYLAATIVAMERHAKAKHGQQASVEDIYRQWSGELLGEIQRRFPEDHPDE